MHVFLTRIRRKPVHFALLVLTAPIIYGMLLPIAFADAFASLYQAVCFRVYRIPRVTRSEYVVFDRAKLAPLSWAEKFNCVYCEYANGVVAYVREVIARTEWYWCPIKHAREIPDPHAHYDRFIGYDEVQDFRDQRKAARHACRACEKGCA